MLLPSQFSRIALMSFAMTCAFAPSANAGPLLDWLFGRPSAPAYPVGSPVPIGNGAGYAPYTSGYAPAYSANYAPQFGAPTQAAPTFSSPGYAPPSGAQFAPGPPTTYSNVPSFRTNYYRAPVTYYRPVLATDPTSGAQVVRMSPCTSYEYQTQRIPTLGQSVYYGNYGAPVRIPAPAAGPTYTLPQAGIPLSRSAAPPITTRGYGSYTTLQPPVTSAPPSTGNYSTNPYGQTPYYGTANGGCSGGYNAAPTYPEQGYTTPGLVAPPSPSTAAPFAAPGLAPPAQFQSPDPANSPPVLPNNVPTAARSQLKQFTQTERDPIESTARSYEPQRLPNKPPAMRPIPVPSDFDSEQHWTPGLLRDEDLTAQNSQADRVRFAATTAGQSKKIQWASFEDAPASSPATRETEFLRVVPQDSDAPTLRMRTRRTQAKQPTTSAPASQPAANENRYRTDNWTSRR